MSGTAGSLGEGRGRQRGAIAIVFALMLVVLVGFVGMSLDLGRVYNRKMDLQAVANAAALAAARQLNGTPAGVANALTQAANIVSSLKYQYNQQSIGWNSAALSFGSSSTGAWVDAATAQAAPDGLLFAKADTSKLDASLATISLVFMRALSETLSSSSVGATAVAGRSTINVAPIAVCALSNTAAAARVNPGPPAYSELTEYGFRRGVAYDLMQLNPNGTTAENFVVDPFDPPGVYGAASNTAPGVVGPYACTGKLAIPRVTGAPITVGRPFPLASLFNQLNSRFDQYSGSLCSFATAPPDTNIKSYVYNTAIPWMSTTPGVQGAASTTSGGKLWTVADPLPAPPGTTAAMYGPLWAYARAVPYSSYVPGSAEPANGYTPFNTSVWSSLYKPGVPVATGSYPSGVLTPYMATNGANFLAPSAAHKGIANRRVLNVALLSCPIGAGTTTTATVLGIGKFLMTVPATGATLFAEFGGLATEQSLGGAVELYQ
ncbi:pilus assembly protein TadE [Rugamonas sp. FT107W]|uniref:Pilus assembly protein TadE n=1 Tax=Duganella vulcania TaxID=2692166 RepID=A0A845HN10_9BURK|nr:pilus assembly protein TadG-related protein [Duganella vulcania]MYN19937.1 pilus assembly protein TadE [Duganella vulcania]